jgi:hypothetical protein
VSIKLRIAAAAVWAWWRGLPGRIRLAAVVAVIAVTGLIWQYGPEPGGHTQRGAAAPTSTTANPALGRAPASAETGACEPDPSSCAGSMPWATAGAVPAPVPLPPVDFNPADARTVAQRFATNFADPGTSREDWLARITPDLSPGLVDQYRLTSYANVINSALDSVSDAQNPGSGAVSFTAAYRDGDRIEIRLSGGIEGWKVVAVLPIDPTPAGSA